MTTDFLFYDNSSVPSDSTEMSGGFKRTKALTEKCVIPIMEDGGVDRTVIDCRQNYLVGPNGRLSSSFNFLIFDL